MTKHAFFRNMFTKFAVISWFSDKNNFSPIFLDIIHDIFKPEFSEIDLFLLICFFFSWSFYKNSDCFEICVFFEMFSLRICVFFARNLLTKFSSLSWFSVEICVYFAIFWLNYRFFGIFWRNFRDNLTKITELLRYINKIFVIFFDGVRGSFVIFLPKFAVFSQSCEETWCSFVKFWGLLRFVLRFFDENCDFFAFVWQNIWFSWNFLTKWTMFWQSFDKISCYSAIYWQNWMFFHGRLTKHAVLQNQKNRSFSRYDSEIRKLIHFSVIHN